MRSEQRQRNCTSLRLTPHSSFLFTSTWTAANLFATARTYTGQQADGTGLLYYHARYFDPAAGQFISPDTLVPDPTNVMDYQRYAYARANPLRYTDPSGHYSVEELIQHFGVSSFQEFHALFGKDGKYAGNSGRYDILRAAQDGDRVTATYANNTRSIQGTFMRNDQGKILINVQGSLFTESEFAHFGGYVSNGKNYGLPSDYGMYHLEGKSENRWAQL